MKTLDFEGEMFEVPVRINGFEMVGSMKSMTPLGLQEMARDVKEISKMMGKYQFHPVNTPSTISPTNTKIIGRKRGKCPKGHSTSGVGKDLILEIRRLNKLGKKKTEIRKLTGCGFGSIMKYTKMEKN